MARLRIGTCSWKYPSWKGLVYSATKGIDFLKEYASRYASVEVDQWFWSLFPGSAPKLPSPADVTRYAEAVPHDFRFTVKVPNSITLTHYYGSKPPEKNPHFLSLALFEEFLAALDPIRERLGTLMFQFEYLNKQKMASRKAFLERLEPFIDGLPPSFDYGLEPRNAPYLDQEYFDFLNRKGLGHVFLQGYWMPPVHEIYGKMRDFIVKQRSAVIRLHGPGREDIEELTQNRWNRVVAPRDEELAQVAAMVEDLLDNEVDVYLNVNNHYEGSAPLTIERIESLLKIRQGE